MYNIYMHEFYNISIRNRLNSVIKDKITISVDDIMKKNQIISGVYLYYCIFENNILFTYVGESLDIYKRLKNHIFKIKSAMVEKIKNNRINRKYFQIKKLFEKYHLDYKDINFIILDVVEDKNNRYISESINIVRLWDKYKRQESTTLNNSKRSIKMKCYNNRVKLVVNVVTIDNQWCILARHNPKSLCDCNMVLGYISKQ
ncbi:hypothetical protein [Spiroplasma endosymbiont of Aspidapion aeneum]|uniref:hypothetical protein n=1 Tax=Spiroplasma endosymbiont of Aspidapion aeneum TaxID=3066276 RepID=UPI00313B49C2